MSTQHVDAILKAKATKALDQRVRDIADAMKNAVNKMFHDGLGNYEPLLCMVMNRAVSNGSVLAQGMATEKKTGDGRALAIVNLHEKMARDFLAEVDRIGEEITELRDGLEDHEHGRG